MGEKRKQIQQARMWKYFLDASVDLIEEKGLQHITVREIADRAGFTSSTVYNYFQDLSHLKFFSVMRYTKPYINELPQYMEQGTNTVERWLYAWECFCKHSFQRPDIYSLLFIENLGKIPKQLMDQYYRIFANDLVNLSEDIRLIITQHNIARRSSLYIKTAVQEGFMYEEDIEYISDTTMLIWTGMLTNMLNLRRELTQEEAAKRTMDYIYKSIMYTVIPNKRDEVNYEYRNSDK